MLVSIIILLILISGSVLCSAKWGRRFEEIVPVTCMSIVLILFIAGILGRLKLGVYLILGLTILIFVYTFYFLIKTEGWKPFGKNMCTCAFGLFVVTYFLLIFWNSGRIPYRWDEFSHWADIVKAMASLDDFGTNVNSYSIFATYPPGMALFQYFFQKIFLIFDFGRTFSEWRIYHAYQIFIISMFMPFLKSEQKENWIKQVIKISLSYIAVLLAPELLYKVYESVYIDVVLGVLTGVAFAKIYLQKEKDWFDVVYILEVVSMLILMKDSGMLFAVFVILTFVLDYILIVKNNRDRIVVISASILSIVIPKVLWALEIAVTKTEGVFEYSFSIKMFIQAVLGIDGTYRGEVVRNYVRQFFDGYTNIGNQIEISPVVIFVSELLILLFIHKYNKKHEQGNGIVILSFWILTVVYIVGICSAYMFNFSSYEALILASYARYVNVIFVSGWIFAILLLVDIIREKRIYLLWGLCVFLVIITPMKDVVSLVSGRYAQVSQDAMGMYEAWSDMISAESEDACKVYVIFQEDQGYGRLALKYMARPNIVNPAGVAWSLGPAFYDGDIWSEDKSAEGWQQELIENYDYVLLARLNEYFIENYGILFEDLSTLETSTLFRVNKATGLLEACN